MEKRALLFAKVGGKERTYGVRASADGALGAEPLAAQGGTRAELRVADLEYHVEGWIVQGEYRPWSAATLANRRFITGKLLWFLTDPDSPGRVGSLAPVGKREIERFLGYMASGNGRRGGRWADLEPQRNRPATALSYFNIVRALFAYILAEGGISESPFASMAPPACRQDQIQPFTDEQLAALEAAAKQGRHTKRDLAIIALLLDTGIRAAELCAVRMSDLDLHEKRTSVLGKGNKRRTLPFSGATARVIVGYLRDSGGRDELDHVFLAEGGWQEGDGLTRSGLTQLVRRLGKVAGVSLTRCSPHTFRHTFAIEYLRAGGDVFSLKEMLGHTSLTMCNRYVAYAQADIINKHRQFSPVARMQQRRKRKA